MVKETLPTAEISTCSEPGTAFLGMSTVKLVDILLVLLRSKKVALFMYCVSPSACTCVHKRK